MPLTFIHTADWHLGYMYRRLGARARDSYQWRFDAVERVFDVAQRETAQFILVAGDVFHTASPTREVQLQAADVLRQTPCPIYLIPGNHDPNTTAGVWRNSPFANALTGHPLVHLLLQQEAVAMDEYQATLFPCPLQQHDATGDPTAWIPTKDTSDGFRIGLAHGQWRGYFGAMETPSTHPIDPARTDICHLDYLAMGDYHSYTPPDHDAAARRAYYSGTPEVTARDEARSGHALLVNIDAPQSVPQVTPCPTGTLQLCHWGEITLQPQTALSSLEQRFAAIDDPANTIITGTLRGVLSQKECSDFQQWHNELLTRVAGVDLDVAGMQAQPSAADFEELNPGMAERAIWEMLDAPFADNALKGDYAEIIASWSHDARARHEAQMLFYQLLNDSQP